MAGELDRSGQLLYLCWIHYIIEEVELLLVLVFVRCCRQLLIYSVRYSNSFAQVAMTTKLQQVEERLGSYDQQTVEFLSDHFSQRTVSLK